MKYDFSGYATKNDIVCTDGRTILKDAFKHNDGQRVPLVWQHMHNEPENILGHAVLENRPDGVYAYCTFNDTPSAQNAKALVKHGDITALSIFANQLKQQGSSVIHGAIREVSLVLTGANSGALIDNLTFAHGDGSEFVSESEAIIEMNLGVKLEDEFPKPEEVIKHEEAQVEPKEKTVKDVFDSMTEEQKNVVYAMLGEAIGDEDTAEHSDEGGTTMRNVFMNGTEETQGATLSHAQFSEILADAKKTGSMKASFIAHADTYGIKDIDFLFPDAVNLNSTPSMVQRNMDWVAVVLNGVHHSPFSRIKTVHADITADEARAKGYITGSLKTEEVFPLLKRVTTPTTVYKKQKLDRDDIIDITDMDVVAFLKVEMRTMLDEELARAILISDGRAVESADKINEANIRPILKDDDFYAHHVALANAIATKDKIDEIVKARVFYKGSGNPTYFTTTGELTDMLLLKDTLGRRLYNTKQELAAALMVNDIVEVEPMTGVTRVRTDAKVMTLMGILVNLKDYNAGADKGGAVSMFEDFDIDYNQMKYLIETRMSGALVLPKSALVFEILPVA